MRRLLGLAFVSACVCACSLVADFTGLVGNADADAGADGAPLDARVDATLDASSSGDAGAMAVDAGSGCETQPPTVIFCADFDAVDGGLSQFQITQEHGAVTVDDTLAKSPPGSMHITQNAISSGSEQNSGDFTTTSSPTRMRLDLDFNFVTVGALNPNTGQSIAAISVAHAGQTNEPTIALNITASSLRVVEVDPMTLDGEFHDALPFNVIDGQWHHVSLLLDMSATQATYALTVDGSPQGSGPTIVTFAPGLVSGEIGLGYQNPPGLDFDGHLDNVVIDTK